MNDRDYSRLGLQTRRKVMSGKAAKIVLTEEQQSILQQIHRSRTAPQRLVQRVSIILLAFAGLLNVDIAPKVALARKQVGLWRRRWQQSFDALVAIECRETQAELRRAVEDILSDAPRSGSTGTFTAEQVTLILAVACEPPEQSGRPIDRWTHRELADEVIARGIVESISISQVGRYLAQAELQPHRSKYWLNTKEKDPEIFQQQVETVCQTYLEAPALYFQENTHTVSVDEMPSWPLSGPSRIAAAPQQVLAQHQGERPRDLSTTSRDGLPNLFGSSGPVFPGEYAHGLGGRDARRSGARTDRQDDPDAARPTDADRV
jgi:Homeodomain-like domain